MERSFRCRDCGTTVVEPAVRTVGRPRVRCDDCRMACRGRSTRKGARAIRSATRSPQRPWLAGDGKLEVTCWCEDSVVLVEKVDLGNGLTGSCGLPDCRPSVRV